MQKSRRQLIGFGVYVAALLLAAVAFAEGVVSTKAAPGGVLALTVRMSAERSRPSAQEVMQVGQSVHNKVKDKKPLLDVVRDTFSGLGSLIANTAFLAGVITCLVGVMQYYNYKNNPKSLTPSHLVVTFVCAGLLLLLSFVPEQIMPVPQAIKLPEKALA